MHFDLALYKAPFLRPAKTLDEALERAGVRVSELEPGQEVERLSQLAAVIKAARDRRQVVEPGRDVMRPLFEDRPPLVLRKRPPGSRLPDRYEHGSTCLGSSQAGLNRRQQ